MEDDPVSKGTESQGPEFHLKNSQRKEGTNSPTESAVSSTHGTPIPIFTLVCAHTQNNNNKFKNLKVSVMT